MAMEHAEHVHELDDELHDSQASSFRRGGSGGAAAPQRRLRAKSIDERVDEVDEDNLDENEGGGGDAAADSAAATSGPAPTATSGGGGGASAVAAAARAARKARKALRAHSVSEEGRFGASNAPNSQHVMRSLMKNSRKPRSGFGRGLPKKGGAGGKGTWGKPGCELSSDAWLDHNDPNYSSDEDESADTNKVLKTLVPEMSEEDVKKAVEPLVLEYFENNEPLEVLYSLKEMLLNFGPRRFMIVSILVELAMDHKPSHREMASVLISELYQQVVSQRDIGKGFDQLLRQLPDLVLDTPDAATILGNFMARAIADDCIPPKFVFTYRDLPDSFYAELADAGKQSREAINRALTLLSMKHGMVRLDNVWGVGGGVRPVKYLIKKIVMLLKEYLCSGDVKEATRCLVDLEVPHFHHELVYEAVVMVIESMQEKTAEAMITLLQSLFRSFIITIDQMQNGFMRVYDIMPEISLDVPAAYSVLESFVLRCRSAGVITDDLVRQMPTRNRRRFVSEGEERW